MVFFSRDTNTLEEFRPVVCEMFHSVNLSDCFLVIDSDYRFLAQTVLCLSHLDIRRHGMSVCLVFTE